MPKVKDLMTPDAECIGERDTLRHAAERLRTLDVGSLPICGENRKIIGMLTDRDIVVKCIAEGGDPDTVFAGDLAQQRLYYIDSEATVEDAISVMSEHQVRRLPVIHDHRLVGIISQADIARHYAEERVGHLVEGISE
ncbi:CBS domain-containing protein [Sinomonas halotolerans]|uniref:CBS domain-containing protein n=1 Tax=Sinomonas halotolerans TaxID=1644133 RepID=A0ABU9WZ70_9MICC